MNGAIPAKVAAERLPAPVFFMISAVFHYLGPAFAVLLFRHVSVLGVAWFRIASAAVVFTAWRTPSLGRLRLQVRTYATVVALGIVLAAMNTCFYLAIARLPLATVGAIEFLGTVVLALCGSRNVRNTFALFLTTAGVGGITHARFSGEPIAFGFAFLNCALFMLYVILGHRVANTESSFDQLALAMVVAAVLVTPFGLAGALPAFSRPALLMAGIVVGVCSSVIPYITDQLAMARLRRETFALMLALLPVCASVIGAVVLRQIPTVQDGIGIALVTVGVALHREG